MITVTIDSNKQGEGRTTLALEIKKLLKKSAKFKGKKLVLFELDGIPRCVPEADILIAVRVNG